MQHPVLIKLIKFTLSLNINPEINTHLNPEGIFVEVITVQQQISFWMFLQETTMELDYSNWNRSGAHDSNSEIH